MRPSVPVVLNITIEHLTARIGSVSDAHLASELGILVRGLQALTQDYDDGASRRVEEIKSFSDLLARGAQLSDGRFTWQNDLSDDALRDLRISALEDRLDVLKRRLIELQTWLEEESDPRALGLLDDIFRFEYLAASRKAFRGSLRRLGIPRLNMEGSRSVME